jgi:hypothetical protein
MLDYGVQPEPEVGMDATWDFMFELHPATITNVVLDNGKAVQVTVKTQLDYDWNAHTFTRREDGVWANEYSELPYIGVSHTWKLLEE